MRTKLSKAGLVGAVLILAPYLLAKLFSRSVIQGVGEKVPPSWGSGFPIKFVKFEDCFAGCIAQYDQVKLLTDFLFWVFVAYLILLVIEHIKVNK
jgi:hypothetical protein